MNVHHLELFYYVARHGGIMPAVRNIPYGIQQPAVSAQVAQLEEFLGVALFQRRPFALTGAGEKLFRFAEPFFGNLEKIANDIQGGQTRHFRIGASTIVLREHMPKLLNGVHKKFAGLKISLREGYPAQLESMLSKDEVDLVITVIDREAPAGFESFVLLELPMVLLVEKNSKIKSAEELWKQDKIEEPLICLPAHETLTKNFQEKLATLDVEWFPTMEASSADLIETYVANGLGVGLSVQVPGKPLPKTVRCLPLPGFPMVLVGALWRGKKSPLLEAFLDMAKQRAAEIIG
ncbi:MAG TPA: LysR family transcriptional regulator [Candidatus Sulfotelmatobacter sp.]|jgi:DNA-binding transcriptional LysR family regulator|nr:LysR family transcriptional regulator [Candidatus Sulfotelmatobacter sp.]